MAYTKHWLTKAQLKQIIKDQPEPGTDFTIPKGLL